MYSQSVQLNGNNFIFRHFIIGFYPHNLKNAIASWILGGISIKKNSKITKLCDRLVQTPDINFVVSNIYYRQMYTLVILTIFSKQ